MQPTNWLPFHCPYCNPTSAPWQAAALTTTKPTKRQGPHQLKVGIFVYQTHSAAEAIHQQDRYRKT